MIIEKSRNKEGRVLIPALYRFYITALPSNDIPVEANKNLGVRIIIPYDRCARSFNAAEAGDMMVYLLDLFGVAVFAVTGRA
jgi:hypothetical protein